MPPVIEYIDVEPDPEPPSPFELRRPARRFPGLLFAVAIAPGVALAGFVAGYHFGPPSTAVVMSAPPPPVPTTSAASVAPVPTESAAPAAPSASAAKPLPAWATATRPASLPASVPWPPAASGARAPSPSPVTPTAAPSAGPSPEPAPAASVAESSDARLIEEMRRAIERGE